MRRLLPSLTLFFMAPFVAEFLLGNLSITMLPAIIVLAPMYGGGALLIREIARRNNRGWPTILILALAYAIIEEAFTTQTLFNPNYLNLDLHLLDHAHIPALGIGAWWTVYVLTLHTVWSIAVSIALTDALFPTRASTPWLGGIGLSITSLLFLCGIAATTAITFATDTNRFIASPMQFIAAAIITVLLIAAAFLIPTSVSHPATNPSPSPWLIAVAALAVGSIFFVIPPEWGWYAVAAYIALELITFFAVLNLSRRTAWSASHTLALAAGAALTYAWHAFPQPGITQTGIADSTTDLIGNAIFATLSIGIIALAASRIAKQKPVEPLNTMPNA